MALETLGFRRAGLSPAFVLLVPAFSLPNAPPALAGSASQLLGMLLYRQREALEILNLNIEIRKNSIINK